MDSQCIQSVLSFSLTLLQNLAKNSSNANILLSPVSIYVALAMVHIGTKSKAREELTKLLGVDYGKLMDSKSNDTEIQSDLENMNHILEKSAELNNAIFTAMDFDQRYSTILVDVFHILIETLSFSDAAKAAKTINNFIEDETRGLIKDMIKESMIDPDLPFMFVNVIFFQGQWVDKFDKKDTKIKTFYPEKGRHFNMPFMYKKFDSKLYIDPKNRYEALVMEIDDGDVFGLFIRPNSGTLASLIQTLEADEFLRIIEDANNENLEISIPRMKLAKETMLKPVFKEMGLKELFNHHEFSLNVTMPIAIDQIIHSVQIQIDEEGVVAAAATVAIPCPACLVTYHQFHLTKPFLFLIVEPESGIPLFMNAIYNPKS